MQIPNEVLLPIVALIFFFLGGLIVLLVSKMNAETKDITEFILELVENFVIANQDLLEKPYKEFMKKIQKWIETTLKIDLTDNQWDIINTKILELYEKLKKELEKGE